MDAAALQSLIVPAIVAVAAASLGVRAYRLVARTRRKSGDGCGGGCCGE